MARARGGAHCVYVEALGWLVATVLLCVGAYHLANWSGACVGRWLACWARGMPRKIVVLKAPRLPLAVFMISVPTEQSGTFRVLFEPDNTRETPSR